MAKAIAGPWIVDPDVWPGMEYNRHIVLENDPDQRICFMAHDGPARDAEFEATATLIAAAPELLEALKALLTDHEETAKNSYTVPGEPDNWRSEWANDDPGDFALCEAARAALRKAGC